MEVTCLMLAPYAELSPDGKVFICSGDVDTLRVPTATFPVTSGLPFYLLGKLTFPEQECGRDYPTRIELVAPDGTVLQGTDQLLQPPRPDIAGRQTKVGFVAIMGMTFPSAGTYNIRLLVDGAAIRIIPLYVEQIPPMVN